jgi:hypothetical protein
MAEIHETKLRTWKVEGVVPAEAASGRAWNRNVNIEVFALALTLEEVVEAVRQRFPDITLHKVIGDRWAQDVIVLGPAVASEETE